MDGAKRWRGWVVKRINEVEKAKCWILGLDTYEPNYDPITVSVSISSFPAIMKTCEDT